ncbi:MAG: CoA transferase [Chloroflexota bacterium]|nr:MAG: CoA transferase [Chloroflexota bacterium]
MTTEPFLRGVRVLDMAEALAGPYCGAILSDLGATVIKVERVQGDLMRRRGKGTATSIPFQMIHRNKQDVAINFTDPRGAEIVRRLAMSVDVFLENFRPGVLDKYGLGHEVLLGDSPRLVYCSISGFGQNGPLRHAAGVDLIAQGYGGLLGVTGIPGVGLAKAGYPVSDVGSGMWAAIGILAALERARRTGEGAYIDVSLVDTLVSWSLWEVADYQMTGEIPEPLGTAHRLTAPYEAFPCADGQWLTIAVVDRYWKTFCNIIGVPELVTMEQFQSEYSRFRHRAELTRVIEERLRTEPRDVWMERLRQAGIPCGLVHDVASMMEDPQIATRNMFVDVEADGVPMKLINTPIRSSGAPGITGTAPRVGEHTLDILADVGYAEGDLRHLAEEGVIALGDASV